jgi:hypothetical protein
MAGKSATTIAWLDIFCTVMINLMALAEDMNILRRIVIL